MAMIDMLLAAAPLLAQALGQTLLLALIAIVCALLLGFALAEISVLAGRWVALFIRILIEAVRGVPVLVFVLLTYYTLPVLGLRVDKFLAGALALSIFFSAFAAEIFRGALRTIPRGQTESGKALGMTTWKVQTIVLLPQMLRVALPALMNLAAIIVKCTSIVSIIGVWELTLATNELVMRHMAPFTFFIVALLLYFVICYSLVRAAQHLSNRLNQSQPS